MEEIVFATNRQECANPATYSVNKRLTPYDRLVRKISYIVLLCRFPVCYDVRLSHLHKDYLFTYLYLLTTDTTFVFDPTGL